ncbi:hypothetical protein HK100_005176 [Physocladia obscura]|uniref:Formamidopyrimidine-DNA glycosylase H2TH DNA-binding domain-containing protein n=1 Tax=Physocladia obscura TaxID=109957 RepID=A0AAD5T7Q1_9FUNG|nr:hypothetical protein HK100_005176 [Physocladia obscura]
MLRWLNSKGMTGHIAVKGVAPDEFVDFRPDKDFPPRFSKFVATLDDGSQFAFADARRLARLRLVSDPLLDAAPFVSLGFDALLALPPLQLFADLLRPRRVPVKAILLDQSFCAGIGNWIADEVLYTAKIHPAQYCYTLLDNEVDALHRAISAVVSHACSVNADHNLFPKSWLFHYRWFKGKRSKSADGGPAMPDGNKIIFETCAGRTTAIIPAVQILRPAPEQQTSKKKTKVSKKKAKNSNTSDEEEDNYESDDSKKAKPTKSAKQKITPKKAPKKPKIVDDNTEIPIIEPDVGKKKGKKAVTKKESTLQNEETGSAVETPKKKVAKKSKAENDAVEGTVEPSKKRTAKKMEISNEEKDIEPPKKRIAKARKSSAFPVVESTRKSPRRKSK